MEPGGGTYEKMAEKIMREEDADAVLLVVANPTNARGKLQQEVVVNVGDGEHHLALRQLAGHMRKIATELEEKAAEMEGKPA